jgi:large subunit ribosomal protein L30
MPARPAKKQEKRKPSPARRKAAKPRKTKPAKPEREAEPTVRKAPERREVRQEKKLHLRNILVAIRLRGQSAVPHRIRHTLDSLRLRRKYNAVLLLDRPEIRGMLKQAKDMVTWGSPSVQMFTQLLEERGRIMGDRPLSGDFLKSRFGLDGIPQLVERLESGGLRFRQLWDAGVKPVFRLHPPRGGFKLSSRRLYQERGELGDRGPDIDLLLQRMV